MTRIVVPATEYVFAVRSSVVDSALNISRIRKHVYKRMSEACDFFSLPEAENVSAVMLNPLGTVPKFNRIGFLAGFGDRRIKMTHMESGAGKMTLIVLTPCPSHSTCTPRAIRSDGSMEQ